MNAGDTSKVTHTLDNLVSSEQALETTNYVMVEPIHDVKIWRQTSKFEMARQISSKMTILRLMWAILVIF